MARQAALEEFQVSDEVQKVIGPAAERYVETRDQRMGLLKTEVELRDDLLKMMNANDLKEYSVNGYSIQVVEAEKVKVIKEKTGYDDED